MLVLGSHLIPTPVMSLQTGTKLAETTRAVINPVNLEIIAYEVEGRLLSTNPSFIRIADIRELSPVGFIVDSGDEFVARNDVVKLREVDELHFQLKDMKVVDDAGHKLGKISDYTIDTNSFIVQQLHVHGGLLRSVMSTSTMIHRSQIVEINNTHIIVKSTRERQKSSEHMPSQSYINPFRKQNSAQPETIDQS